MMDQIPVGALPQGEIGPEVSEESSNVVENSTDRLPQGSILEKSDTEIKTENASKMEIDVNQTAEMTSSVSSVTPHERVEGGSPTTQRAFVHRLHEDVMNERFTDGAIDYEEFKIMVTEWKRESEKLPGLEAEVDQLQKVIEGMDSEKLSLLDRIHHLGSDLEIQNLANRNLIERIYKVNAESKRVKDAMEELKKSVQKTTQEADQRVRQSDLLVEQYKQIAKECKDRIRIGLPHLQAVSHEMMNSLRAFGVPFADKSFRLLEKFYRDSKFALRNAGAGDKTQGSASEASDGDSDRTLPMKIKQTAETASGNATVGKKSTGNSPNQLDPSPPKKTNSEASSFPSGKSRGASVEKMDMDSAEKGKESPESSSTPKDASSADKSIRRKKKRRPKKLESEDDGDDPTPPEQTSSQSAFDGAKKNKGRPKKVDKAHGKQPTRKKIKRDSERKGDAAKPSTSTGNQVLCPEDPTGEDLEEDSGDASGEGSADESGQDTREDTRKGLDAVELPPVLAEKYWQQHSQNSLYNYALLMLWDPNKEKTFVCAVCFMKVSTKNCLKRHICRFHKTHVMTLSKEEKKSGKSQRKLCLQCTKDETFLSEKGDFIEKEVYDKKNGQKILATWKSYQKSWGREAEISSLELAN